MASFYDSYSGPKKWRAAASDPQAGLRDSTSHLRG